MSCISKFFEFYADEDKTLSIQLKTNTNGCIEPFDLTGATEIDIELPATPDNLHKLLSLTQVVVDSPILGKIHSDLVVADLSQMISGSIVVRVTKGGKKTTFLAAAASKKNEIPNC